MIERICTMSDIRVIGNDIFYQGVKVGSVNEDSRQALNFRDILDKSMDDINSIAEDWDMYNVAINNVLDMIDELKDCRNIGEVKKTIKEKEDDIKDVEQMVEDMDNALYYFGEN